MWCDAIISKPSKDVKVPDYSEEVLIWIEDQEGPRWAYFNFVKGEWIVDMWKYEYRCAAHKVKYFAYISNPYK